MIEMEEANYWTDRCVVMTIKEHRRGVAGGEFVPRPGLDTDSQELFKFVPERGVMWRYLASSLKSRYTKQSVMEWKQRSKYHEYFKRFVLNPNYQSPQDGNYGLEFVSDWSLERERPLIEVRDRIIISQLKKEERYGLDQFLFHGMEHLVIKPGMLDDTSEESSAIVVPEEMFGEYEILTKLDTIEREISNYKAQHPEIDIFNENAILNAIGKRKEYGKLKRMLENITDE
jgi:hypothetical protein